VIGMPLTEIATRPTPTRASASCSRTSSMWARCRCCWTWTPTCFEKLFAEQYKGKERLLESNVQALHLGRNYVQEH
jgi:2-oxoglutarate ferredoxin oxidoreductase subunit alpha